MFDGKITTLEVVFNLKHKFIVKFNLKLIFTTPFQKNIATLFSGTLLAQLINVIGALFLAKIYAPEFYGAYSVFLSFVSILTIVNSLKLEYVIITDKSEEKSNNMVNAILIIVLIVSAIHLFLFALFEDFFFKHGIIYIILLLSSITSIFLSNAKLLESYATRKSWFKNIANARVLMAICTVLFQFVLFYYSVNGLIYGYTGAVLVLFIFYIFISKNIIKKPDLKLFKNTIKYHKNIIRFAYPSGLINGVANYILPILILAYFSAAESGVYALGLKVVSVPLFIISSSISQVYFQKASDFFNHAKYKLYDFTKKVALTNILIMLAILLVINTIGIYLLELFFDKDWENLSIYIVILSFFVLGQVAFSPISSLIVIINKMHIGLIFNITLAFINFIAIYVGQLYNNIVYTVLIFSIVGGLSYIILLIYFLSLLKTYKKEV